MPALERDLRLLRAYAVLTYPFVCVPFLYLYFARSGLDLAGYGSVVAVYYLVMFAADVPTSILADRCGRRAMLVAGPLLLASGFATLFCWRDLHGFYLGEALLGLGHSMLSGPPSAMLYELLRRHGQQQRYLQEESTIHALRLCGTGGSFLLGGAIAWWCADQGGFAYAATIPPSALLCALAALVATRMHAEPAVARSSLRTFLRRAGTDLRRREVLWLLAYWIVLFALLRYPFHNYQVYLDETARQEPLFGHPLFAGLLFAALNLVAAPLSHRVPLLVGRWGRRPLFWGMPIVLALSLLVMAAERLCSASWPAAARPLAWLGVTMFFVQQIPFGMHWALVQEFVNHRISADARATVWSALSLGSRLSYAPLNQGLFALQAALGSAAVLGGVGVAGLLLVTTVLLLRPRGLLGGSDLLP